MFPIEEKNNENNENAQASGSNVLSLTNLCDDDDINSDAIFVDRFQGLIESQQTSKLFTPYMSQLKFIHRNARRSLKRRIEQNSNMKKVY